MTDETAKTAKAAALTEMRKTDPSARALWSVKGPKDEPGMVTAVLTGGESGLEIVLLHTYGDKFDVYKKV